MDGWGIVICTLIGGAVGGIYGLFISLRNKAKQKNQAENQEAASKPKRFNPIPLLVMVIIAVTAFTMVSLLRNPTQDNAKKKNFSKAGLTITLTNKFHEKEMVSYTAVYNSESIAVFALKEEKSLLEGGELTLEEYADLVISNNQLDATVKETEGLTSFTFEKHVNGKDCTYFAAVYKGNDAYWLLQFSCESTKYEGLKSTVIKYAKSVTV